jgi:hypothetical protein
MCACVCVCACARRAFSENRVTECDTYACADPRAKSMYLSLVDTPGGSMQRSHREAQPGLGEAGAAQSSGTVGAIVVVAVAVGRVVPAIAKMGHVITVTESRWVPSF